MPTNRKPIRKSPKHTHNTITGTVVDETRKPLANVVVTIMSPALSGNRQVVTDDSGSYRVAGLPAGEYSVEFDKESFNPISCEGIALKARITMPVDAALVASREWIIEVTSEGISPDHTNVRRGDAITFAPAGDSPPTSVTIAPDSRFRWPGTRHSLFDGEVTTVAVPSAVAVPSTHTVATRSLCVFFSLNAGSHAATVNVDDSPEPPEVITLTSGGIFPSETRIRPERRIAFATAGKNAPTSVTVTSHHHLVPDTALFGGESNSYAVPSTHTVQSREYSEDIHSFTITTNLGQTAQIITGFWVGDPMNPNTKPTK